MRQVDAALDSWPTGHPSAKACTSERKTCSDLSMSERARVRNREIGFIFQAFNLIGDLTVYENVELPAHLSRYAFGGAKEAGPGVPGKGRMAHRMKHYPSQLSGGQQQRVAVARAWAASRPSCSRTSRQEISIHERRSRDGSAARTASRGRNDLHGHARSAIRAIRRPYHSPVRWPESWRSVPGRTNFKT